MSIAPTRWLSALIILAGVLTFVGGLATVLYHAEEIGAAVGVVVLALLGITRRWWR